MPKQYPYGDIKFYYGVHVNKQKALGNKPVKYITFIHRLRRGYTLHDAIYQPRVEYQVRDKKLTPTIEDNIRRREMLNEENIQILDFDEMERLEILPKRRNMKPPKKTTLLSRFLSLFK